MCINPENNALLKRWLFPKLLQVFTIEYSPESETGSSLRKKSRLSSGSSLGISDFQTIHEKSKSKGISVI